MAKPSIDVTVNPTTIPLGLSDLDAWRITVTSTAPLVTKIYKPFNLLYVQHTHDRRVHDVMWVIPSLHETYAAPHKLRFDVTTKPSSWTLGAIKRTVRRSLL